MGLMSYIKLLVLSRDIGVNSFNNPEKLFSLFCPELRISFSLFLSLSLPLDSSTLLLFLFYFTRRTTAAAQSVISFVLSAQAARANNGVQKYY